VSRLNRLLHSHHPASQAFRFLAVGGTGLVVNLAVVVFCNKVGPDPAKIALDLPVIAYNVRWYHVFAIAAFLVANLTNFQLNRSFTFRTSRHRAGRLGPQPRGADRPAAPGLVPESVDPCL
jgi:putative flippase GtrA